MPKKIELLAPAGSMDSLKAAIAGGCDAVYLGLSTFSARAFAGNFTHEEFPEAVRLCHLNGVKVYVTLNTLLFEEEMENALKEAQFLYEQNADAVLVQDLGLFLRLRREFPDLDLHCSTQMHIHNAEGARFMHAQGAKRVVLARETPIEKVREITALGIETEIFGYGALCISYSGQCLMSAALKNRSGNRGMCAQYCRMKYRTGENEPYSYLLSPKDLNVLPHLPEIIEAGVSSLKIEGRMKRPEYVYLAIRTFREAIDAYYTGKSYTVSKEREKELKLMFNRGFTEGHLFHADIKARMDAYRPNHRGITAGTVKQTQKGRLLVKLSEDLHLHDGLRILAEPEDIGISVTQIILNNRNVREAHAGDEVWISCPENARAKRGQKVQKTTDSVLTEMIRQKIDDPQPRVPVYVTYTAYAGTPLIMTIRDDDGHCVSAETEIPTESARAHPLTHERITGILEKTDKLPYRIEEITGKMNDIFLPVSVINAARREAWQKLNDARLARTRAERQVFVQEVINKELPPYRTIIDRSTASENTGPGTLHITEILPVIAENGYDRTAVSHTIIREIGALSLDLQDVIAGMTFNVTNSYAAEFLLRLPGIAGVIISSEVNDRSAAKMRDAWLQRHHCEPPLFRLVYGRRTLMYIKDGFRTDMPAKLEDLHHEIFPVRYENGIAEILENHPVEQKNDILYGNYLIMSLEL